MFRYFTVALLLVAACNASTPLQQPLVPGSRRQAPKGNLRDSSNSSVLHNFTFDDFNLNSTPNQTLTGLGLLQFDRFEVVNTTSANEHGFLPEGDIDAAVSKPNALCSMPMAYKTPAVIRTNATALAAAGLNGTFDIVSFSVKPLGPAPAYTYITFDLWKLEGGTAAYVDGLFISWLDQEGFLEPVVSQPSKWWPGWGEGGDWIEIQARTLSDEVPWEFCLDNLVLRFHERDA